LTSKPLERETSSDDETAALGAELAEKLFARPRACLILSGPLGAGKTALARGFTRRWCALADGSEPGTVTSPSYNVARVYGSRRPVAHLDLYRLKTLEELEQIGFENYFQEASACVVEWLENVPGAERMAPADAVRVELSFVAKNPSARLVKIRGL
jgi:tRNA threonylcarbamoyl adenosine modification protein YjeE